MPPIRNQKLRTRIGTFYFESVGIGEMWEQLTGSKWQAGTASRKLAALVGAASLEPWTPSRKQKQLQEGRPLRFAQNKKELTQKWISYLTLPNSHSCHSAALCSRQASLKHHSEKKSQAEPQSLFQGGDKQTTAIASFASEKTWRRRTQHKTLTVLEGQQLCVRKRKE